MESSLFREITHRVQTYRRIFIPFPQKTLNSNFWAQFSTLNTFLTRPRKRKKIISTRFSRKTTFRRFSRSRHTLASIFPSKTPFSTQLFLNTLSTRFSIPKPLFRFFYNSVPKTLHGFGWMVCVSNFHFVYIAMNTLSSKISKSQGRLSWRKTVKKILTKAVFSMQETRKVSKLNCSKTFNVSFKNIKISKV